MTYCSKKECKLGVACKNHMLNIPNYETKPCVEDLSNNEDFCIIKHYQEKPCKE